MIIGLAASRFQSRRMEFDADRYAARVAGSKCFKNALLELGMLDLSSQKTWHEIASNSFKADEIQAFPESIQKYRSLIDHATVNRIKTHLMLQKTSWLDTHPSMKERFESIEKENAKGNFMVDVPATVLISNFNQTVKKAMIEKYLRQ